MTGDPEIRAALVAHLHVVQPASRLAQEWPIQLTQVLDGRHWSARIDVAAIGEQIDGYEIKSAADSRARLAGQVMIYGRICDRCWLVAAPVHLRHAPHLLPAWWGLIAWDGGTLRVEREAGANPHVDGHELLWQLWCPELRVLADEHAATIAGRRPGKHELVASLAALPFDVLRADVRRALVARRNWRTADGRTLLGDSECGLVRGRPAARQHLDPGGQLPLTLDGGR